MFKTIQFTLVILFLVLSPRISQANVCVSIDLPTSADYTFDDNILIPSSNGVSIAANILTPTATPTTQGYPTIIFVNSWVLDEHEYLVQAIKFAKKGYLVLSYSARGWGCSGGQVDVSGDKDMQDVSYIVDWLAANTQADLNNIGMSGISYGSGISLMALAKEPRIKTAVAMSTWASLTDALYQHQSPRMFWGFLLVSSGLLTANLDPEVPQNYVNLITHQDIPNTLEWAENRSVKNWIHLINEKNAPVYLANNFGDNLFQPNNLMKFYEQITSPKKLDLNQGTHASGEGFGLVGIDNYTFNNTHKWFDYWLKNESNGLMDEPPVSMLTDLTHQRDHFSEWPSDEIQNKTYYMKKRGLISSGKLTNSEYKPWWSTSNKIYSGIDTLATTGIPALSALVDAHLKIPVITPMGLIQRTNGITYYSDTLSQTMKLRGIPKVRLNLKPSRKQFQLVAYLYDVSPSGFGRLITHAPFTEYDATAGQVNTIDWELVATAYDIPKGHRVAITFDTFDLLYAPPTLIPYSVSFQYKTGLDSILSLPIKN